MDAFARFRRAVLRYGWRFPFVAAHYVVSPLGAVAIGTRIVRLRLLNKCAIGSGVVIEHGVRITPRSEMNIGSGAFIGRNCTLAIVPSNEASVTIGENSWISVGCLIQASSHLVIGQDVLIGEYVSIRDTQHQFATRHVPRREQGDTIGKVTIEDDVWVGRGALILGRPEGVVIGRGAVIAANSVIHRSVPEYTIWGGAPGRQIGCRPEAAAPDPIDCG